MRHIIFVMILMAGLGYGGIAWSQPLYAMPECPSKIGIMTELNAQGQAILKCYPLELTKPAQGPTDGCGCGKILRVAKAPTVYTGWKLDAPNCVGGLKESVKGKVTIGGKTEEELLKLCPGMYTP